MIKNKFNAQTLKEKIDPHDFYLSEQSLLRFSHKSGRWATAGLCPFHDDRTPGSFKINLETGAFKCWSCGENGSDIIAFLQKRDQLSFLEVLNKLSKEWETFGC